MPDIEGLRAFVEVAGSGGFTSATRKLGVSKSIVSRRVAGLEAELGVRLLSRTTRGVSLTDAGIELNRRAVQILAELDATFDAVAGRDDVVAGTIRISAPLSFGIVHLSGALAAFAARHPHVQMDVAYSDRFVDLVAEGFDLAVRIGELKDSSLIARRLCRMRAMVVASPLYLARRGTPKTPRDLSAHDALIYTGSARSEVWRFRQGQKTLSIRMQGRFRADNGDALREAAIAGLGIAYQPSWMVAGAIASGALVQLLGAYDSAMGGLYAVRPPGSLVPGKVRALIDFLAARFDAAPFWDGGTE